MKAGIIAAGQGRRLSQGGICTPKPLIPIGGKPMIARIIHAAATLKVTSVACIVNDLHPAVENYLRTNTWPVPLEIVVRTTPSSMESLFGLIPHLQAEPCILFTVDTIFACDILKGFLMTAQNIGDAKGVLALTRFVDDEKPLWVKTDKDNRILMMGDAARPGPYVTAGFYYFHPDIYRVVEVARMKKLNALRQFLGLLVESGFPLYGVPVLKTVDVDYPEDIQKAESYLREVGDGCAL